MDKDYKRIRNRYIRSLVGLLVLIILLIIKPGVAVDNNIIKLYYYASIIGVMFVLVVYPLVINCIDSDNHLNFWTDTANRLIVCSFFFAIANNKNCYTYSYDKNNTSSNN